MRYLIENQETTTVVRIKLVTHTFGDLFPYGGKHWIPEQLTIKYTGDKPPVWDLIARAQVKGSGPGKTTKHFSPIMVQSGSHAIYLRLDEIAREADPRTPPHVDPEPTVTGPKPVRWRDVRFAREVEVQGYTVAPGVPDPDLQKPGMVGAACFFHPTYTLYLWPNPLRPGHEVVGCALCFDAWRTEAVVRHAAKDANQ